MAKDVQGHDTPGNGDGKEVDLALGSALGATTSSVGTQRSVHKGVRERLTWNTLPFALNAIQTKETFKYRLTAR